LSPIVLLRTVQGVNGQLDGNLKIDYKKVAWLNLTYRHNVAYAVTLGGVIDKKIVLGYTYELPSTELANHSSGTHELLIGYKFGKQTGGGGTLSDKELRKLQEAQDELFEKTDYLEQENVNQNKKIQETNKKVDEFIDGLEEWKKSVKMDEAALLKFIEENSFRLDGTGETDTSGLNRNNQGKAENNGGRGGTEVTQFDRDKFGYFVVVGASRKLENAKKFQKIVLRENKIQTNVIRNNKDTWYLIYTAQVDSPEEASFELNIARNSDKKGIYVGKPWIYQAPK